MAITKLTHVYLTKTHAHHYHQCGTGSVLRNFSRQNLHYTKISRSTVLLYIDAVHLLYMQQTCTCYMQVYACTNSCTCKLYQLYACVCTCMCSLWIHVMQLCMCMCVWGGQFYSITPHLNAVSLQRLRWYLVLTKQMVKLFIDLPIALLRVWSHQEALHQTY